MLSSISKRKKEKPTQPRFRTSSNGIATISLRIILNSWRRININTTAYPAYGSKSVDHRRKDTITIDN